MYRKLLTGLVSACALAAALIGPASASADTLTLTDANGNPASFVDFESSSTTVTTSIGSWDCDEFTLPTEITQNTADPVTLQLGNRYSSLAADIGGCQGSGSSSIDYSNIQLTGPMEFNADGTGTLPLRVTETWTTIFGPASCVREGVLDLTYTPNESVNQQVNFAGDLNRVSGGTICPTSSEWSGWFDAPIDDEELYPIDWVVSPPTLSLNDTNGNLASSAEFESPATGISSSHIYTCQDGLTFGTAITQNQADPVTLQLSTATITPSIDGCQISGGSIEYSNIQFTAAMEFNADGTGTLPLRVTETWQTIFGVYSCVREGVLDLTYTPNQSVNQEVDYDGDLDKVSGSSLCPNDSHWQGAFDAPTENNDPIDWVVTG